MKMTKLAIFANYQSAHINSLLLLLLHSILVDMFSMKIEMIWTVIRLWIKDSIRSMSMNNNDINELQNSQWNKVVPITERMP